MTAPYRKIQVLVLKVKVAHSMRKYNINASIIRAMYDNAQSAALFSRQYRTTAVGCLLSPILFNTFLERITYEALDDHEGSVNIGGRLITNFCFADDIVVNAEEEEEAGVLVDRLSIQRAQGTKWRSVQARQK